MADERPDHSLDSVPGERGLEKPALFLVRYFQVKEADYMKPPLAEQLLEPDGEPAPTAGGVVATGACTCNLVCTCVPVSACACNTVCTCNTVSSTYGVPSAPAAGVGIPGGAIPGATRSRVPSSSGGMPSGGGGRSSGGGHGGYYAPCF